MTYEPHVCPHTDPQVPLNHIAGWRDNLTDALVSNAPKSVPARIGYLGALYVLRMLREPPAYYRAASTAQFQACVDAAIRRIEAQEAACTDTCSLDEPLPKIAIIKAPWER